MAQLRTELDRLGDTGRTIRLWWRDDDAVADSDALTRLLASARGHDVPISLAVVPAHAEAGLADRCRGERGVTALVHGWRHANHAAAGEKRSEFGAGRTLPDAAEDATSGLKRIEQTFGACARPVFVPPWNRLAPGLVARLPALGYRAVSCFGRPLLAEPILRIDTHIDPVDWHGTRGLVSPETLLAMFRRALAQGVDPIGLLTHHLVFDEALWAFTEAFIALAAGHPAVRPVGIDDLLQGVPSRLALSAMETSA